MILYVLLGVVIGVALAVVALALTEPKGGPGDEQ